MRLESAYRYPYYWNLRQTYRYNPILELRKKMILKNYYGSFLVDIIGNGRDPALKYCNVYVRCIAIFDILQKASFYHISIIYNVFSHNSELNEDENSLRFDFEEKYSF